MSEFSKLIDNSKLALSAVKSGTYNGIIETAINVAAQAKELAPVDTAMLKGSIMWKAGTLKGGITQGKELSSSIPKYGAIVGTATEYAVYQEFGTRKMPAQPYLRPAVDIVIKDSSAVDAVARAMEDSVKVLKK